MFEFHRYSAVVSAAAATVFVGLELFDRGGYFVRGEG
jgi:hypothetical protein